MWRSSVHQRRVTSQHTVAEQSSAQIMQENTRDQTQAKCQKCLDVCSSEHLPNTWLHGQAAQAVIN